MNKPKGMLAWVYRTGGSDTTNGGVSSRYDRIVVVGPGIPEVTEPLASEPVLYLERWCGGYRVVPDSSPETFHMNGPMSGGNFVFTSDSRWPSKAPIPIFDRFEKWY